MDQNIRNPNFCEITPGCVSGFASIMVNTVGQFIKYCTIGQLEEDFPYRNKIFPINQRNSQFTKPVVIEEQDHNYDGDSLPFPKKTVEELDKEMDEYFNVDMDGIVEGEIGNGEEEVYEHFQDEMPVINLKESSVVYESSVNF